MLSSDADRRASAGAAGPSAGPRWSTAPVAAPVGRGRRRWLPALGLALVAGLAVAAATWYWLPASSPAYVASALLKIEAPGPRSPKAPARAVLQATLRQPAVAGLSSVRHHPGAVLQQLDQALQIEGPAAPVIRLSLSGPDPAELVLLVNAAQDAYVQEVEKVRAERRARLAFLEQFAKEVHQELAAGPPVCPPAAQDEPSVRELEVWRQYARSYENYIRSDNALQKARLQLEAQVKAPPDPQLNVPAAVIAERVDRDPQLQNLLRQAMQLQAALKALEGGAVSEKLDQYRARQQFLADEIQKRREILWPAVEKALRGGPAPVSSDTLALARAEMARLEANHRELAGMVSRQLQAALEIASGRRKLETKPVDELAGKQGQIERLRRLVRKVQFPAPPGFPGGKQPLAGEAERRELASWIARCFREVLDLDRPSRQRELERLDLLTLQHLVVARLELLARHVSQQVTLRRSELAALPVIASAQAARQAEPLPAHWSRQTWVPGLAGAGTVALVFLGLGWRPRRTRRRQAVHEAARDISIQILATLMTLPEQAAGRPGERTGGPAWRGDLADSIRALVLDLRASAGKEGKAYLPVVAQRKNP